MFRSSDFLAACGGDCLFKILASPERPAKARELPNLSQKAQEVVPSKLFSWLGSGTQSFQSIVAPYAAASSD